MRVEGKVIQWDDAKGYGFIAPSAGGSKIFVHARAFGLRARRPFVGERVTYEVGLDGQGKSRAMEVRSLEPKPAPAGPAPRGKASSAANGPAGIPPRGATAGSARGGAAGGSSQGQHRSRGGATSQSASRSSSAPPAAASASNAELWLIPIFASLVLLTHLAWPLPHALWGVYMAMSLATFIVYALDKRAARLGQWRVKESTLHGLALLCGWPGALLAQHLLRHKSAKASFRRGFWLSTALNILLFVLIFTPLLPSLLRQPAFV